MATILQSLFQEANHLKTIEVCMFTPYTTLSSPDSLLIAVCKIPSNMEMLKWESTYIMIPARCRLTALFLRNLLPNSSHAVYKAYPCIELTSVSHLFIVGTSSNNMQYISATSTPAQGSGHFLVRQQLLDICSVGPVLVIWSYKAKENFSLE